MDGPHRRVLRAPGASLVGLAAVLGLLVAVLALPSAHTAFSARTGTPANSLAADRLQPPSGLTATQSCSTTPSVAFRGATTATGGTSLTLSPPATTQAGDVLLAQVAQRYGATTVTAPSGWTHVRTDTSGTAVTSTVYWKVAVAGEPAAVFSRPVLSSGEMVGGIVAYSGAHGTMPVAVAGSATGQGISATTSSLSTSATDVLVVHFLTKRQEDLPAPTGTTQRWRLMSGTGTDTEGVTAADEPFAGTGATASRTATSSAGFWADWIAQSVVLRRAPGTPSVVLSWTSSPSSWAAGYQGERIVGGTIQGSSTVPLGTTTVTDPGLVNGTTYTYRVRAYRGSWVSPDTTATLTPSC